MVEGFDKGRALFGLLCGVMLTEGARLQGMFKGFDGG